MTQIDQSSSNNPTFPVENNKDSVGIQAILDIKPISALTKVERDSQILDFDVFSNHEKFSSADEARRNGEALEDPVIEVLQASGPKKRRKRKHRDETKQEQQEKVKKSSEGYTNLEAVSQISDIDIKPDISTLIAAAPSTSHYQEEGAEHAESEIDFGDLLPPIQTKASNDSSASVTAERLENDSTFNRPTWEEDQYDCFECDAVFLKKSGVWNHWKKCHRPGRKKREKAKQENISEIVDSNGRIRRIRKTISSYMKAEEDLKACDICGQSFEYRLRLRKHLTVHEAWDANAPAEKLITNGDASMMERRCGECNQPFFSLKLLHQHQFEVHSNAFRLPPDRVRQKIRKTLDYMKLRAKKNRSLFAKGPGIEVPPSMGSQPMEKFGVNMRRSPFAHMKRRKGKKKEALREEDYQLLNERVILEEERRQRRKEDKKNRLRSDDLFAPIFQIGIFNPAMEGKNMPFVCPDCNNTFEYQWELSAHKMVAHLNWKLASVLSQVVNLEKVERHKGSLAKVKDFKEVVMSMKRRQEVAARASLFSEGEELGGWRPLTQKLVLRTNVAAPKSAGLKTDPSNPRVVNGRPSSVNAESLEGADRTGFAARFPMASRIKTIPQGVSRIVPAKKILLDQVNRKTAGLSQKWKEHPKLVSRLVRESTQRLNSIASRLFADDSMPIDIKSFPRSAGSRSRKQSELPSKNSAVNVEEGDYSALENSSDVESPSGTSTSSWKKIVNANKSSSQSVNGESITRYQKTPNEKTVILPVKIPKNLPNGTPLLTSTKPDKPRSFRLTKDSVPEVKTICL